MTELSDIEILAGLNSKGKDFEDMAQYLFELYRPFILTLKQKLFLPQAQLNDAYADAIVKVIRQIKSGKFKAESKLSTYFYSIFYNTAVDVTRKNATNKNMKLEELFEYDHKEQDLIKIIDDKSEVAFIMNQIDQLGSSCKKILIDWAYLGYSMEEIANRNDLSNAESARSMKYKCLKKLKAILKSQ